MKRKRYSDEQIAFALGKVENGTTADADEVSSRAWASSRSAG